MSNFWKWIMVLALGAFGGICQAAVQTATPTYKDYLRGALIGIGPAVIALRTTLEK